MIAPGKLLNSAKPSPTGGMTSEQVRAAMIRSGATYPTASALTDGEMVKLKRQSAHPCHAERMAMIAAARKQQKESPL